MTKGIRCRLGIHAWKRQRNDAGQGYRTCTRCGLDDDPGSRSSVAGG
jgi:hypothetical protein